jgi:hypothetical protein
MNLIILPLSKKGKPGGEEGTKKSLTWQCPLCYLLGVSKSDTTFEPMKQGGYFGKRLF